MQENKYPKMIVQPSWPDITDREIRAVVHTLRTTFLGRGPKISEFEEKLARIVGRKFAVSVSNGTAALHLAHLVLGIKEGDLVITTPFSFISSANSILFVNARPIFVDIDPSTFNVDPKKIEEKINEIKKDKDLSVKLKAILAVDVYGQPADWEALEVIARQHKLALIGDSCEALGSSIRIKNTWRNAGTFGDISVFSFAHNKQVTTGEGGALLTDNEEFYESALSLRNHGKWKGGVSSKHERLGYNYHMSDIQCALGVAQLDRLDEIAGKREKLAALYNKKLEHMKDVVLPFVAGNVRLNWFTYVIRLSNRFTSNDRDVFIKEMEKHGIRKCRNYFPSIHLDTFYRDLFGYKKGDFPITEDVSAHAVSLPFFDNLTDKEVEYVVEMVSHVITKHLL